MICSAAAGAWAAFPTKHPRGYLRDSGLLQAAPRTPDVDALPGHPQMGASREGMVIEEILRQLHTFVARADVCARSARTTRRVARSRTGMGGTPACGFS